MLFNCQVSHENFSNISNSYSSQANNNNASRAPRDLKCSFNCVLSFSKDCQPSLCSFPDVFKIRLEYMKILASEHDTHDRYEFRKKDLN